MRLRGTGAAFGDVIYVKRINYDIYFAWQYLVKLECHFLWQAHHCEILRDSRSATRCIFPCEMRLQDGTTKVSEGAGAR